MPGLLPNIDPDGLLEYSVVYTDRSLNHMSSSFQRAINDVSSSLKKVYNAESVVLVPGGGTYGMEAVARQFATDKDCLVLRNGWFSYRWSQILEMGHIPAKLTVLKATRESAGSQEPFAPVNIDQVVEKIKSDLSKKDNEKKKEATQISEQISGKEYAVKKLSTENNELYGSVKPTEIAKLIQDENKINIKPSMIQPVEEIKSLGKFKVKVSLHSEVDAEITVNVTSADTIQ